jgi:glycosyltransferase 2 family protein
MAHSFIEGLQILPDIKRTLSVFFLSLVLWSVIAFSNYMLFFSYGFGLPPINAFAILVIVALGVMLPAAPGFVGTYHYACVLGLTSFGIAKPDALSYAIALHFLQLFPIILIGLLCLPFQKMSLPKMIPKEEVEKEDP